MSSKQKPLFTATLQLHYGIADAARLHAAWEQAAPTIRGQGDIAARNWATLNGVKPVRELPAELRVETMTADGFDALTALRLKSGTASHRAARAVLVDGLGLGDAARLAGLKYTDAHKAIRNIRVAIDLCKKVVDSVR